MKNPNGIYTVRLHFAELDKNTPPGKRRFNILINGKIVLENLDVINEAGSKFKALVKEIKGIAPDKDQKITIELKDISSELHKFAVTKYSLNKKIAEMMNPV